MTETAPPTVVPGFPQVKLWPEAASFAVDLLGPTGMQREHFERCSALAASVPFRRLLASG